MRRAIPLVLLLSGFGPFTCDEPKVEEARRLLDEGKPAEALEILPEEDAPEVHFARAVAQLTQGKGEEAGSSLDQVNRGLANRAAEGDKGPVWAALQGRLAFARGVLALENKDWAAAQIEFLRVLDLDPKDEDARWNLELAWYHEHPPCPMREDDHERDDTMKDAQPWSPEKHKDRLLCPGNEDWYSVDLEEGAMLYASLTGEVIQPAGEREQERKVNLALFEPGAAADQAYDEDFVGEEGARVGADHVANPGRWTLRVSGPGRAEFKYALALHVVPPCPVDDKLEENDTAAEARELKEDQQSALKACPDDSDWYKINIPAKEGRRVSVSFDPERGPLNATLTDETGFDSLAEGKPNRGGVGFRIPAKEEAQTVLLRVWTVTQAENLYSIQIQPDENEDGKDKQQNQDQNQDQQDQQNKDQQDQKNKDQQDEKEQQQQQQQEQLQKLMKSLDEQTENPQLKKALKQIKVLPELEDY